MDSLYFPKMNENANTNNTNETFTNSFNKNKEIKDINSSEPFKAFSSALFMSEYQENEETLISSNSNSDSNKKYKSKNSLDLNISPSLEKCLTSELLESMADDSSNIKLRKNSIDNSNNNNEQGNDLKITKRLFEQNKINNLNNEKEKNGTTFYDDNINGFEYQLKFIENSVHNILPKSYKKFHKNNFNNNNNNYAFNKNYHRVSFPYSNRYKSNNNYNYYKNSNEKFNYSKDNNMHSVNVFYPNLINKNGEENNQNNNFCESDDIKNQILNQIQKVKSNENNYEDWICNNCKCFNRGYRKICINCKIFRIK